MCRVCSPTINAIVWKLGAMHLESTHEIFLSEQECMELNGKNNYTKFENLFILNVVHHKYV